MNCKCALQKRSAVGLRGTATTTTLYFINVKYNSVANIACDISLSITSNLQKLTSMHSFCPIAQYIC